MTASLQIKRDKYFVVLNWVDESGKRKQKWVGTDLSSTGNNKRKAEQKRLEILREWETKITLRGNDILFSVYLDNWLEETKSTIAYSTYCDYKRTIQGSICPYFESRKILLCDLKTYHIQEFYNFKLTEDKLSPNTIHHYHAYIHKALDYAVKTERLNANPSDKVDLPKKVKHVADFYTADEIRKVVGGAMGTQLEAPVLLGAWFGMRRGEILGLKWECIDFNNCTLSVTGTVSDKRVTGTRLENLRYKPSAKTDSSIRTFPMHPTAVEYFQSLKLKQDTRKKNPNYNHAWDEFVCVRENGDLIPPEYVSRTFPKLCEKCGLRKIGIHELRHSNISLLLENGASMKELQEWAGHSSYSTTANIYSHVYSNSKQKLSETLENILR